MERDESIAFGHYDLGLRIYNPATARMFSRDPRASEYPWQSPYIYHRNSPIWMIDFLGGGNEPPEEKYRSEKGVSAHYGEVDAGVGIPYIFALGTTVQSGIAKDEAGTVFFEVQGSVAKWTLFSDNTDFFYGLDIGLGGTVHSYDDGAPTFEMSFIKQDPVIEGGAFVFDFAEGDANNRTKASKFNGSIGGSYNRLSMSSNQSIALSPSEAQKVVEVMEQAQKNVANQEVTGSEFDQVGTPILTITSIQGEGNERYGMVTLSVPEQGLNYSTGIKVFDKRVNNIWKSEKYLNGENGKKGSLQLEEEFREKNSNVKRIIPYIKIEL